MLGLRWRFALGFGAEDRDDVAETVVAAVLVLAVVVVVAPVVLVLELLLVEDPVLLLSEDFDAVNVSLGLVRDLEGFGSGGAAREDEVVFVRSFLACFVLTFSSSSEEGHGELRLRGAAENDGARFRVGRVPRGPMEGTQTDSVR
jgi:hypothetical protein